jgi:hypothetical protein
MAVADLQNPKTWSKVPQDKLYLALHDRYVDPIGRDKEATRTVSKKLVQAAAMSRAPQVRLDKIMQLIIDVLEKNALYAKGLSSEQLRQWENNVASTEQDPRYAAANKKVLKDDMKTNRQYQSYGGGQRSEETTMGTCPAEVWALMPKEAKDAYIEARGKQKAKRK